MGAADLDDIAEGHRFFVERGPQRLQRGISFSRRAISAATCIAVGNTSFELWLLLTSSLGFFAPSPLTAQQFTGAVGQHLVHVHVALGAGTGLPDSQRELLGCFRPALRQRRRRSPRLSPPSAGQDPD
jgi:hypothetical protein